MMVCAADLADACAELGGVRTSCRTRGHRGRHREQASPRRRRRLDHHGGLARGAGQPGPGRVGASSLHRHLAGPVPSTPTEPPPSRRCAMTGRSGAASAVTPVRTGATSAAVAMPAGARSRPACPAPTPPPGSACSPRSPRVLRQHRLRSNDFDGGDFAAGSAPSLARPARRTPTARHAGDPPRHVLRGRGRGRGGRRPQTLGCSMPATRGRRDRRARRLPG